MDHASSLDEDFTWVVVDGAAEQHGCNRDSGRCK